MPPRSSISSSSASARSTTARACSIAVSVASDDAASSSASKRQLAVVGGPLLELALEVAQGQVGQVVGALVGPGEVRRQRGVADRARAAATRAPPARASGPWRRAAPWCASASANQVDERGVVLGRDLAGVDARRPVPSAAANATDQTSPVPEPQRPWTVTPARGPRDVCSASQSADLARAEPGAGELEPGLVDRLVWTSHDSSSRSRSTRNSRESNRVCTSWRSHDSRLEVVGRELEVEVADQLVELAVADHVAEVLAQRLALLAGDLVGVGDDVVEAVVLLEPAGGEPRPDARHAGQVVGRLPHDRRELGVARRARRRTSPRPRPGSSAPARRRRASGRAPSTAR